MANKYFSQKINTFHGREAPETLYDHLVFALVVKILIPFCYASREKLQFVCKREDISISRRTAKPDGVEKISLKVL